MSNTDNPITGLSIFADTVGDILADQEEIGAYYVQSFVIAETGMPVRVMRWNGNGAVDFGEITLDEFVAELQEWQ